MTENLENNINLHKEHNGIHGVENIYMFYVLILGQMSKLPSCSGSSVLNPASN